MSRGKQKKNSRKNKAMESGQEADLEREEVEFEHMVERESVFPHPLCQQKC